MFNKKPQEKQPQRTIQLQSVPVVIPVSFDDIQSIIDTIKQDGAIVVRFSIADDKMAQRFVDFLSGAIYAIDGSAKQISADDYLFTANNTNVVHTYGQV